MKPPSDLTPRGRGRGFWIATMKGWDLTGPELEILAEAARTLDELDGLREAVAVTGVTVEGSRGQVVVNPALSEMRQARAELRRLLEMLSLPDPEEHSGKGISGARSARAAKASRTRCTVARVKGSAPATEREDVRQKKLAEVRERARKVAEIVVRLPKDRAKVRGSEARAELLSRFGLTAATGADVAAFDEAELVAETADHYAVWFGQGGPSWIRDEHYCPGREETLQIAAEELDRARRQLADH